jgi:NADH dehydrogenase/NADH:ubiquinone oxidoreductase subunit G
MNYQMDSNGKAYAIGGEVKVDLRPENSTFATKKKADAIMTAALSPDRPSIQDRMVATQALQLKINARSAEMDQQSQRTSAFFTKIKQDQDGVLSRVKNTTNKTFASVEPYDRPLKNLGDITYEAKRNSIRIPKPVAPDGSVQVADSQKEVNISPAIGDTEKLPFGGTSFKKSSALSEAGKVRQRINSPVVAIGGTLKTETKPVIYTSQVESYEKIKKIVGDEDKIAVRLVDRDELEHMIHQQPEQFSQMEDDEYLASNISSFLATI